LKTGPLTTLANYVKTDLVNAFERASEVMDDFGTGIDLVATAISRLISKVVSLIAKLKEIPKINLDQYVKESPVPLAEGLKEIGKQARSLSGGPLNRLATVLSKLPSNLSIAMSGAMMSRQNVAAPSTSMTNVNRSIFIEINPTYRNVQSEASIYYDVTAALAAART
jgi:hypothetical protein